MKLDGIRKEIETPDAMADTKPTLAHYQSLLNGKFCKNCFQRHVPKKASLANEPIEHYDHSGGWPLAGHDELQWLYVECSKCEYQWALSKLGIPRT